MLSAHAGQQEAVACPHLVDHHDMSVFVHNVKGNVLQGIILPIEPATLHWPQDKQSSNETDHNVLDRVNTGLQARYTYVCK